MPLPTLPVSGATDWYAYAQALDAIVRSHTAVTVDGAPAASLDVSSTAPTAVDVGAQPVDADLTTIAAIDTTTPGVLATEGAGWLRRSWAQLKTSLQIAAADLTASGTRDASTYLRGDNTWATPAGGGGGAVPAGAGGAAVVQGFKAMAFDPVTANNTFQQASIVVAIKLHTAVAISLSEVWLCRGDTQGSGLSGYYAAIHDGSGALLAQSADFSALFAGANQPFGVPLLSAASVPAGTFYVTLRLGAATTPPNLISTPVSQHWRMNPGLSFTAVAPSNALAPRLSQPANTWSGAAAPATLGNLSAGTYFFPWLGVR